MYLSPQQLHIPDGFLSLPVAAVGWAVAAALLYLALRRGKAELGTGYVPMMGVLAAFIFAAQAINFPVAAGTSGHLLGGALAAIVLGPWSGFLVMTAVVALQGLLFQDGGLLVMGWNIVNMGAFTTFPAYAIYSNSRRWFDRFPGLKWVMAFFAAWLSVVLSATATSIELGISGTWPIGLTLPMMTGVHALIGLGEGIITVAALRTLTAARPDVLATEPKGMGVRSTTLVTLGLGLALIISLLSPWASPWPDGLEFVADQVGALERAVDPFFTLLHDYQIPVRINPALATIAAVGGGVFLAFGIAWLLGRSLLKAGSAIEEEPIDASPHR